VNDNIVLYTHTFRNCAPIGRPAPGSCAWREVWVPIPKEKFVKIRVKTVCWVFIIRCMEIKIEKLLFLQYVVFACDSDRACIIKV